MRRPGYAAALAGCCPPIPAKSPPWANPAGRLAETRLHLLCVPPGWRPGGVWVRARAAGAGRDAAVRLSRGGCAGQ